MQPNTSFEANISLASQGNQPIRQNLIIPCPIRKIPLSSPVFNRSNPFYALLPIS
jgi:hypothetical protein